MLYTAQFRFDTDMGEPRLSCSTDDASFAIELLRTVTRHLFLPIDLYLFHGTLFFADDNDDISSEHYYSVTDYINRLKELSQK